MRGGAVSEFVLLDTGTWHLRLSTGRLACGSYTGNSAPVRKARAACVAAREHLCVRCSWVLPDGTVSRPETVVTCSECGEQLPWWGTDHTHLDLRGDSEH